MPRSGRRRSCRNSPLRVFDEEDHDDVNVLSTTEGPEKHSKDINEEQIPRDQESTSRREDNHNDQTEMLKSISLALENVVEEIREITSVLLVTRDGIRENMQMTQEIMQINRQMLYKLKEHNPNDVRETIQATHRRPFKHKGNNNPRDFTDSESEGNASAEDTEDNESLRAHEIIGTTQDEKSRTVRIPNFTGKENWKTWINRFEDLAERNRWSTNVRLNKMLPCFQGQAGDFVFGQLSRRTRGNYHKLVEELGNRYKDIETAKTYSAQFSRRVQRPGESIRDYAADLKCLYGKAHRNRNNSTRTEDLLRRFYDGLLNTKASFEVEYHKEPKDIDEAVYYMVMYEETRRKPGKEDYRENRQKIRRTELQDLESDTDSEQEDDAISSQTRKVSQKLNKEKGAFPIEKQENMKGHDTNKTESREKEKEDLMRSIIKELDGRKDDRSKPQCQICNKPGHEAKTCYQLTRKSKRKYPSNQHGNNHTGPGNSQMVPPENNSKPTEQNPYWPHRDFGQHRQDVQERRNNPYFEQNVQQEVCQNGSSNFLQRPPIFQPASQMNPRGNTPERQTNTSYRNELQASSSMPAHLN